ncbi:MAG: helix-turn-helix transcriptional regulator [bacterium]
MNKEYDLNNQLIKFGHAVKKRREALGYSVRKLEENSGISKTLISQVENCLRESFPKKTTIKLLNDALKFKNNELLILADVLASSKDESRNKDDQNQNWQEKLQTFLAVNTELNVGNIQKAISFTESLIIIQNITDNEFGDKFPALREKFKNIIN